MQALPDSAWKHFILLRYNYTTTVTLDCAIINDFRLFNDHVAVAEVIQRRMRRENDHEWLRR
jgi:hypothetical protein